MMEIWKMMNSMMEMRKIGWKYDGNMMEIWKMMNSMMERMKI